MSKYVTHKTKKYLKPFLLQQANAAIEEGAHYVLPVGVTFESTSGPDRYKVIDTLPFKGRFLVQRVAGGEPVHATGKVVRRVVDLPTECPPPALWERFDSA